MDFRIIRAPTVETIELLVRRKGSRLELDMSKIDAIGLVQGKLIDMVVASDIATKAYGVVVEDIKGSCPQNMILLAIFGDTNSVESAISMIKSKLKEEQVR